MPELTPEQRAERIACCIHIINSSWAYDLLKDVARSALAALQAEPWGYTSGIRNPDVNGAVVRDKPGINQFPAYLTPPAAPVSNEAAEVARAALDYIDALPSDVAASLPAMPRFDRDWAENVLKGTAE